MQFREAFRFYRQEAKFSQRELARRNGSQHSYISHLEAGRFEPPQRIERLLELIKPMKLSTFDTNRLCYIAFKYHSEKLAMEWRQSE